MTYVIMLNKLKLCQNGDRKHFFFQVKHGTLEWLIVMWKEDMEGNEAWL